MIQSMQELIQQQLINEYVSQEVLHEQMESALGDQRRAFQRQVEELHNLHRVLKERLDAVVQIELNKVHISLRQKLEVAQFESWVQSSMGSIVTQKDFDAYKFEIGGIAHAMEKLVQGIQRRTEENNKLFLQVDESLLKKAEKDELRQLGRSLENLEIDCYEVKVRQTAQDIEIREGLEEIRRRVVDEVRADERFLSVITQNVEGYLLALSQNEQQQRDYQLISQKQWNRGMDLVRAEISKKVDASECISVLQTKSSKLSQVQLRKEVADFKTQVQCFVGTVQGFLRLFQRGSDKLALNKRHEEVEKCLTDVQLVLGRLGAEPERALAQQEYDVLAFDRNAQRPGPSNIDLLFERPAPPNPPRFTRALKTFYPKQKGKLRNLTLDHDAPPASNSRPNLRSRMLTVSPNALQKRPHNASRLDSTYYNTLTLNSSHEASGLDDFQINLHRRPRHVEVFTPSIRCHSEME